MLLPLLLLAAAPTDCAALVQPYGERPHRGSYRFDQRTTGGGRLVVFGAEHSRDPAAAQFARLRAAFDQARPSIAFYEGSDRPIAADGEETIRIAGESGYTRFLARHVGAAIARLEPSPVDQIVALGARFPADEVMLFLVLREAVRLRDREGKAGPALDEAIAVLLAKAAPLATAAKLETSIRDLATLEAAARRAWPERDWRMLPADWFSPRTSAALPFTNRINAADSENRNRHMVGVIDDAVRAGGSVFVVVGRDHVPALAPALSCVVRRATPAETGAAPPR